jgi:hypothetical protein
VIPVVGAVAAASPPELIPFPLGESEGPAFALGVAAVEVVVEEVVKIVVVVVVLLVVVVPGDSVLEKLVVVFAGASERVVDDEMVLEEPVAGTNVNPGGSKVTIELLLATEGVDDCGPSVGNGGSVEGPTVEVVVKFDGPKRPEF